MKNIELDFALPKQLLYGVAEECSTNLGKFLLFFDLCVNFEGRLRRLITLICIPSRQTLFENTFFGVTF